MKKKALSLALVLVMTLALLPTTAFAITVSQEQVYANIIAMESSYPEGMSWTNDNYYEWKGGIYSGGHGCSGFAFLLSDAAFGDLPARMLKQSEFAYSDVRVGDILRINDDTHSVIVLEIHENDVIIAEGNFNKSIHWGRSLSRQTVMAADYLITRYPTQPAEQEPSVTPVFADVPAGIWYADAVSWAVDKSITAGTSTTTFSPDATCTQAQILTFLWRSQGEPAPAGTVSGAQYYAEAAQWATEQGLTDNFSADAPCTRAMVVTYLWRLAGRPEPGTSSSFADVPADLADAVSWAAEQGITSGTGAATFSPATACTRGQIVTFLYRAYK